MLVVQKYGGSSLCDAGMIRHVARKIALSADAGYKIVATVSAMGDSTDDLITLAHGVTDNPDPRELDVLLSTGELISCSLVAMALKALGKKSVSLSGAQAGIQTNRRYGRAKIAGLDTKRILAELDQGNIVIVAGFQGITENMDITTLGRGASDLTAVALSAALGATKCEIYTDVDGIYTADPKLVPQARKLDEIGFEEMLELASYGAKMNPRSVELGMVYEVPILVASSFEELPGTLIHQGVAMKDNIGEIRNRVRGITTEKNVAKITVLGVVDRPGIAANLFEPLARADISVDVIVQNTSVSGATDLTFTVKRADLSRAVEVTEGAVGKLGGADVDSSQGLAKISLVGTGMQNTPGYASKMFRALADSGVNIEMITTSEIRITCIVKESLVAEAATALHDAFQLDKDYQ